MDEPGNGKCDRFDSFPARSLYTRVVHIHLLVCLWYSMLASIGILVSAFSTRFKLCFKMSISGRLQIGLDSILWRCLFRTSFKMCPF